MTSVLFPLWQVDRRDYDAICAYLRFTPNARLYDRLSAYLAEAPFRFRGPVGFACYLAELRLGPWRIARLDLATKLFIPNHPIRHALNAVLALHECGADGYRELAASPRGSRAMVSLVGWLLGFGANLAVTMPWLGWQFLNYAARVPFRTRGNLAGRRVLVSGVSRGLGWDLMLDCLERGAEVIGVVRNREARDDLALRLPAGAPVRLVVADLSVRGALVDALGQAEIPAASLSLAIACAAVKREGTSILSLPDLRETFEVNFFAAVELAQWLVASDGDGPHAKSSATALVLVSSMGRWHGMHSTSGYNASKAALSIWGESLEMELRRLENRRISITLVEPGLFASRMTRESSISRFLFAPRRTIAGLIVSAGLEGRRVIRPPLWFAFLTWGVCLLGRDFRFRLFARAKPGAGQQ